MPNPVNMGTMLTCTFGVAPSPFTPTPMPKPVLVEGKPVGTIQDFAPMVNIMPFGMCNSPSNPLGLGKPTPVPPPAPTACIPITTGPWVPLAPTKLVGGKPILLVGSVCNCAWAGVITAQPMAVKEQVS